MDTRRFSTLVLAAVVLLLASSSLVGAAQKDVGQDHPLLTRFPGSVIVRHKSDEFDALLIPVGKATGIDQYAESASVEGKVTRITYEMPVGHSTAEVFRSYRDALLDSGFDVLYSCEMNECGDPLYFQKLERPFIIRGEHRYLAVKGDLPQGGVYVTVRVYTTARQDPPVRAMVNVVEVGRIDEGLVKINAEAMAAEIGRQGHVALYGIYFDTDKADIKPASKATLDEMGKFLADHPEMKVYIVGHSDNAGTLSYNMDLSRRRAESVMQALVAHQGIDPERLVPRGVGPLAPVASNRTDEGRARNRRVDMVAQ